MVSTLLIPPLRHRFAANERNTMRATWRSKSRFNFTLHAVQGALNSGFVWRKLGAFSEVTESVICEAKTPEA